MPRRSAGKLPPRKIIAKPEPVKDKRRLSNWPPGRLAKWRLEALVPWKLMQKAWQFKNWSGTELNAERAPTGALFV